MLSRTVFNQNANIPFIYFEVKSIIYKNCTIYNKQLRQKEHSTVRDRGKGQGEQRAQSPGVWLSRSRLALLVQAQASDLTVMSRFIVKSGSLNKRFIYSKSF